MRTIDNVTYPTFPGCCTSLWPLLQTKMEGFYAMVEAVASFSTPAQLRFLFTRIVLEWLPCTSLMG
jgi:hypothetical protein